MTAILNWMVVDVYPVPLNSINHKPINVRSIYEPLVYNSVSCSFSAKSQVTGKSTESAEIYIFLIIAVYL